MAGESLLKVAGVTRAQRAGEGGNRVCRCRVRDVSGGDAAARGFCARAETESCRVEVKTLRKALSVLRSIGISAPGRVLVAKL